MRFHTPTVLLVIAPALVAQDSQAQVSQKALTGFWQADKHEISDGLLDTYQFFADGAFIFTFSEYRDAARVRSIRGKYSLKGAQLSLQVLSRTEEVGGKIVRGSPAAQGEWIIEGGKTTVIPQPSENPEEAEIELFPIPKIKFMCIKIDGRKYFKLSSNPARSK